MAKKQKPLSQQQRDYIAALWRKERTAVEISAATGISEPDIAYLLRSWGVS